jgi:hypothetical protein
VFGFVTSALTQITPQTRQAVTDRVIKDGARMWELDGLADNVVDRLVIATRDAETSIGEEIPSSDTDSDMEGIHPLLHSDKIISDESK